MKSRGALGTSFTYAPVSLYELYLAINGNRAVNRQPIKSLKFQIVKKKQDFFLEMSFFRIFRSGET